MEERPGFEGGALRLSSRNPLGDARKVFKGNPALRVFSLRHYLFADLVVYVSGETFFFPREFLEFALC